MKRIFGILFALLLVACLGLLTQAPDRTGGPAYAAGAQPMALAGTASTISPAGPVPAGTLVQAYVGIELRAQTTTEAEGLYRNLLVPGPAGMLTFKVAGVLAQESITWESGEIMDDFDLTIPALPSAGYSLTMAVAPAGTGTATDMSGASPYAAGVSVSIKAVPAAGYQFSHWTAAPAVVFGNANAATTTFTMPAQAITVTANFAVAGPTTWYVVEGGAGAQDGINWDDAFATIQEAIDVAGPGDTIMVAAGEYDAFIVEGKANINIISTEGATVTTAASYWAQLGTYLTYVQVMAMVEDSENINIEGIDFDGTGVGGEQVCGIFYLDSTGRIADVTVENVITDGSGVGVVIEADLGTSTVEIIGSTISENDHGIWVFSGSTLEAHFNNIVYNSWGVNLVEGGVTVDVTRNWWGDASGPYHASLNPDGLGDVVYDPSDNVVFEPWLGSESVTETVEDGPIDAIDEAEMEVVVDGKATVIISKYTSNPYPEEHPGEGEGELAYLDLLVQEPYEEMEDLFRDFKLIRYDYGTEIEIRLYYTEAAADDFIENTLRLGWSNGGPYALCELTNVVTTSNIEGYRGYIWASITDTTTPSLQVVNGTAFGGYGHPSIPTGPGFCSIATAAYGTDTAEQLDILREFRDTVLLPNGLGAKFVSFYYRASPTIADFISQNEVLRTAVRVCFVDPIVKILTWSHGLWSARG